MKILVLILAMMAVGTSAWGVPVDYRYRVGSVDVGVKDVLKHQTRLSNSGDDAELNWVRSVLDNQYITLDAKYDTFQADWQKTDVSGVYALSFQQTPDYFLIKTGGTASTHFLFQNLDSFSWAVIALSDVNITSIKGVSRISHVDEFSGTNSPVPEPGTMTLLCCGILFFGAYCKRRIAKT